MHGNYYPRQQALPSDILSRQHKHAWCQKQKIIQGNAGSFVGFSGDCTAAGLGDSWIGKQWLVVAGKKWNGTEEWSYNSPVMSCVGFTY